MLKQPSDAEGSQPPGAFLFLLHGSPENGYPGNTPKRSEPLPPPLGI